MLGKIVYAGEYDKGGHSATFERPDALADMRKVCGKGGGPFGVVRGKNGYARDAIPT